MITTAIVTGASSGIGAEFARQLGALPEVDCVWLVARRRDRLEVLDLGGTERVVLDLDLSVSRDVAKLVERLDREQPDLQYLVNCAGYSQIGPFSESVPDLQLGMIDVNIRALTQLTHAALPLMRPGGLIINVSSMSAYFPMPRMAVYAATKAYVLSFTLALGTEVKRRGIRCLTVAPGPVRTEFHIVANKDGRPSDYRATTPQRVVSLALRDGHRGRAMSIQGLRFRVLARMLSRLIPKRWLAQIVDRLSF